MEAETLQSVDDINKEICRVFQEGGEVTTKVADEALRQLSQKLFAGAPTSNYPSLFPLPNPSSLAQGTSAKLVRGVALVQDIEGALSIYQTTGKKFFMTKDDEDDHEGDVEEIVAVDAQQLYLVPVPGWGYNSTDNQPEPPATRSSNDEGTSSRNRKPKRSREDQQGDISIVESDYELVIEADDDEAPIAAAPVDQRTQRHHVDEQTRPPRAPAVRAMSTASQESGPAALPHTASASAGMTSQLNLPHDALSPSLECACVCCYLRPSTSRDAEDDIQLLKVNDVVEVIGFLKENTIVPQGEAVEHHLSNVIGGTGFDDELEGMASWRCLNLPASIVGGLTAVALRPIFGFSAMRAGIPRSLRALGASRPTLGPKDVEAARRTAIGYLSKFLQGDTLAATYLVLQLISRLGGNAAQQRKERSTLLGDLPLHFLLPAQVDGTAFVATLSDVVRRIAANGAVHISSRTHRHCALVPRKTPKHNHFVAGLLQLQQGVHLSMDLTEVVNGDEPWNLPQKKVKAKEEDGDDTARVEHQQAELPDASPKPLSVILDDLVHQQRMVAPYDYAEITMATEVQFLGVSGINQTVAAENPKFDPNHPQPHAQSLLKRCDGLLDIPFTIPLAKDPESAAEESEALGGRTISDAASSPLSPSVAAAFGAMDLSEDSLWTMQSYFAQLAEQELQSVGDSPDEEALMKTIADEMVEEKKAFPERFNNSPLIHNNSMSMRMSLVRCIALSRGSRKIEYRHWQEAQELERWRSERCRRAVAEIQARARN